MGSKFQDRNFHTFTVNYKLFELLCAVFALTKTVNKRTETVHEWTGIVC